MHYPGTIASTLLYNCQVFWDSSVSFSPSWFTGRETVGHECCAQRWKSPTHVRCPSGPRRCLLRLDWARQGCLGTTVQLPSSHPGMVQLRHRMIWSLFLIAQTCYLCVCVIEPISRNANCDVHPDCQLCLLHRSDCSPSWPLRSPICPSTWRPYVISYIFHFTQGWKIILIRNFELYPSGETLQIRVSWDEYRDKIVDYGHIKIYAMASVQETKQAWSEEDDFQLEKPKLDLQVWRRNNNINWFKRKIWNRFIISFSFWTIIGRSAEILKLARTATPRSVSWTRFQSRWQNASSLSKALV